MAAAEGDSRFTTLDDNKIHYVSYGKGKEAIVFIHGWTCDSTFWKTQAPVYESRRALLIDLPGHGLSDKPEIPYTMELFARSVDAVMTAEKVERATLVGHSMGTPVAAQFLRMHPEKVKALVIVDGFVPLPAKDETDRIKQNAYFMGAAKAIRSPDYMSMTKRMLESMFTKQTDPDLRREIETKMLAAPQFVMASAMEGMAGMDPITERYPDLPVAAFMKKRANSAEYETLLKQHFRLLDFREFDAGHFIMMEQPAKFNQALLEFLARK